MSRMLSRAERLRTIERLLYSAPDGLSAVEIARRTGVGRRTVYRDLDLLSQSDVPIWQGEGRFGIIRDRYLTTVRLNFHEAVALFIAARLLTRLFAPGGAGAVRIPLVLTTLALGAVVSGLLLGNRG
ncbi:MAG: hypothetical protein C4310_14175, partial [Chloroflexota bacterium]